MTVENLQRFLPMAEDVLELEPEELAGVLLRVLLAQREPLSLHNFVVGLDQMQEVYPRPTVDSVKRAIIEAWVWLQNNGLVAPGPGDVDRGWSFITRKGRTLDTQEAFASFQQASKLPRQILHGNVSAEAWPMFIRGQFDAAVFQAFKEVEVAVREASGLGERLIGVPLMRAAFDKTSGPLTDMAAHDAEREALAHLFSGAIGSYKNPQSHRRVGLIDAAEAGDLLILASHLLRIVDDRARRGRPPE